MPERVLGLGAVLAVASCQPAFDAGTRVAGSWPAGGPGRAAARPDATGSATLTIRWPERSGQAIPGATARILVTASPADRPLVTRQTQATRPAGAAQTTVTLTAIPVGPTRISAIALDADGNPLASGATKVTIAGGQSTAARVTLDDALRPSLRSFWPANAVPGGGVTVHGSGFAAATMSLAVGGALVPAGDVSVSSDGVMVFKVPAGATTSIVAASFGDVVVAAGTVPFVTIASVSLSPPATATFTPSGLVRFQFTARDHAGVEVPRPSLFLRVGSSSCAPATCLDEPAITQADLIAGASPGTVSVTVGSGAVQATAIVEIHPLVRGDLAAFGLGPLGAVPYPAGNEPTDARVALGRELFFDVNISTNSARPTKTAFSCASCHDANKGWGDGLALPLGNDKARLGRNAPTALDSAYQTTNFWDGRAPSLEAQALGVIGNAREFATNVPEMVAYVKGRYAAKFSAAYGIASDSINADYVVKAIASFERKKVVTPPGTAALDRWANGDDVALSAAAKRGLALFMGRAQCVNCHNGPLLADGKFHNIGIPGSGTKDFGRIVVTGAMADLGAFRTPTVRNVELTGPYMHDGSKATLTDVLKHYTTFDDKFPNLSPLMPQIRISSDDEGDLTAFLKSLTATQSHL